MGFNFFFCISLHNQSMGKIKNGAAHVCENSALLIFSEVMNEDRGSAHNEEVCIFNEISVYCVQKKKCLYWRVLQPVKVFTPFLNHALYCFLLSNSKASG